MPSSRRSVFGLPPTHHTRISAISASISTRSSAQPLWEIIGCTLPQPCLRSSPGLGGSAICAQSPHGVYSTSTHTCILWRGCCTGSFWSGQEVLPSTFGGSSAPWSNCDGKLCTVPLWRFRWICWSLHCYLRRTELASSMFGPAYPEQRSAFLQVVSEVSRTSSEV